ncbi:hypothetical protein [Roseburia inulinivorans]
MYFIIFQCILRTIIGKHKMPTII